jgi:hypothetical protein
MSAGPATSLSRSTVSDSPDKSQLLFQEEEVTPRFGLSPNDAYDLALFKEKGSSSRGVLVVTVKLQFFFADGRAPREETSCALWFGPRLRSSPSWTSSSV